MTTWMIDLLDRVGQRVLPTAPSPQDLRFRKVEGDTLGEALDRAQMEANAIKKLRSIHNGDSVIMSDTELDWLIDQDVYPTYVVSIPNPNRCGLLDAFLVASKSHPTMKAYAAKVMAEYEAQPAIRQHRQQQGKALAAAA